MSSAEADAFLLDAVQRGDDAAWREVIVRYQGRLLSFARRQMSQRSEAEDVVQETFLGLLRSLPTFDRTRSLETYLFAILRHKLYDQLRRLQSGQRESLDQLGLEDASDEWLEPETPSRHAAGRESVAAQRAALVAGLRQWVEQCQTQRRFLDLIVVEMLMVLGLRNKEVAADLNLTETAVAGIKFRVLDQWRKATLAAPGAREWEDADLAADSTLGKIWSEEGISCLKRSTLGRYLLGTLDEDWHAYIAFHVEQADCDRCRANLDDLREEDAADAAAHLALRERCFASSIGFLSRRPDVH